MFDLAAFAPDFWGGPQSYEPNSALHMDGDFLSEDFCVIGGDSFFVRCVVEIAVQGVAEKFGYGAWSSLSRANFERYADGFDAGTYAGMGPWTSWFSNQLEPFGETLRQPAWIHLQLDRQRPTVTLDDPDHPLSIAQEQGITPEQLMEIYAMHGHAPAL